LLHRRRLRGKRGLLSNLSFLCSLSLLCSLGLLCGVRLKSGFCCLAGLGGWIAKRSPGMQGCIRVAARRRAARNCYAGSRI
jgi:hypothetical protein